MASHKSTQETKRTSIPPKMLSTTEAHGRVRVAYFDFTVPAGGAAVGDTVDLARLPKGARILGGDWSAEAMSSGAGDAQMSIGDGTTAARFLAATSVDAVADGRFANTLALGFGAVVEDETTLVATVVGEAWAAGNKLAGWAAYVLD